MNKKPTIISQFPNVQLGALVDHVNWIDATDVPIWELSASADILLAAPITNWLAAPTEIPPTWPGKLSWVHTVSAGVDFYPPWLLNAPTVTCSRGVAAVPVAEYIIAAILEHNRGLYNCRVRSAENWTDCFNSVNYSPPAGLVGQTLGILGTGAISQAVSVRALAMGMRVVAWRKHNLPPIINQIEMCLTAEQVIAQSDHLVLALPYTRETHHILNTSSLQYAKPNLHIINVARGGLINQDALIQSLETGQIASATLDVTSPEPLPRDHPLYSFSQVRITPHVSWISDDGVSKTSQKFIENLSRFLAGNPLLDRVDPRLGY